MASFSRINLSRLRTNFNFRSTSFIRNELLTVSRPCSQTSTAATAPARLSLTTGGFVIPHPQKVAKGGEDAYYIAERSFGVADGVGGWAELGIDPGEYARTVMREAKAAVDAYLKAEEGAVLDPTAILTVAHSKTERVIGSSTAVVLCVEGEKLLAANIGDSGFLVVRDGQLEFASPPQQHRFNFPFQIGTHGDPVTAAQAYCVDIQPGDVIIAGTDGLLDNVFNDRSAKLVWDAKSRGATPGVAAQQLAVLASGRAFDPLYQSPFAKAAMQSGFFYRGGKVDDITVVVSYVLPAAGAAAAGAAAPAQESDDAGSVDSADSTAPAAVAAAVAGASAAAEAAVSSEAPTKATAGPKAAVGPQAFVAPDKAVVGPPVPPAAGERAAP
eukprot:jgi/Ulvmu1/1885/UM012_0042.1